MRFIKSFREFKIMAHALRRQGYNKAMIAQKLGVRESDLDGLFRFKRAPNGAGKRAKPAIKIVRQGPAELIEFEGHTYKLVKRAA